MANTSMKLKNTFQQGLVMDFAPDVTSALCLSSALNATLVTYNGNEMSLQNDMGNGRVETAFLPEGYIPVGTCEFGDIIYIVSYNPLINKSLIGCFPSPERNISTDEIGGLLQSLKASDFLDLDDDGTPTGKLIASSVKKVLYDNRDMNSGDKYIVYSENLKETENNKYLSDYGNPTHEHGKFPKLVKIHVVSIEESGKIVYLDSTTKWYDSNDYYLNTDLKIDGTVKDLDSYRTMVSSAYSIFSSKVSGKLALLVELEKITGFSCSWSPYIMPNITLAEEPVEYTNYQIYWNFNWTTDDNNINPNGVVLMESEWTGVDKNREGYYQLWENIDDKLYLGGEDGKNWESIGLLPIKYDDSEYWYTTISRQYKPEGDENGNTLTFEEFINGYEYTSYLLNKLNDITVEDVTPYKLNIYKKDGNIFYDDDLNINGNYYLVNCTNVYDNIYYTTNLKGEATPIDQLLIKDDIVNNYFHYPVIKHFADFSIPTKLTFTINGEEIIKTPNISNLIYHYKVAPTMPYGILEEFTLEGYIDFSKIGTKSIGLNTWKYYNYDNTSTLTWGIEAYTEPGKGISEVVFEFYDNNGFAGAYHNKGKASYNGTFTEYITLGESGTNYKLNNIDHKGLEHHHPGLEVSGSNTTDGGVYVNKDGNVVSTTDPNGTYYKDDCGTLYPNFLYLVKIIIKYCNKGVLDEYIEDENNYIYDYRWYWTNTMFNEYYYLVLDFKELLFTLNLDCAPVVAANNNYLVKLYNYSPKINNDKVITTNNMYESLSANILTVNIDGTQNNNVKLAVYPGLYNNYNSFNIDEKALQNLLVTIYLAKDYISNSPEQPSVIFTEEELLADVSCIYPTTDDAPDGKLDATTSETLNTLVGATINGTGEELYDSANSYLNYKNEFKLYSIEAESSNKEDSFTYLSSNGEEITITDYQQYDKKLSDLYYNDGFSSYFNLTISGIHYSKYMYLTKAVENVKTLRSFVLDADDLEDYNLKISTIGGTTLHFDKILLTSNTDKSGGSCRLHTAILGFDKTTNGYLSKIIKDMEGYSLGDDGDIDVHKGLDLNMETIKEHFTFLFPFGYGHGGRNATEARVNNNDPVISSNKVWKDGIVYNNLDLGGTLAGICDSAVEPGNHHVGRNMLVEYVPIVFGYLTLLFYLTNVSNSSLYIPNNYIYLQPNYCSYKKDIVLKITISEQSNNNILLQGMWFLDYLEKVTAKFENQKELLASPNVTLKMEGCIKTQPVEFLYNYITPTAIVPENSIIVSSIFSDIPTVLNLSCLENKIYGWDPDTQTFKELGGILKLRKISNFTTVNSAINATISNNASTFNLGSMNTSRLFTIVDNQLRLKDFPAAKGTTYKVNTHSKKSGEGKNRALSGYKNIKFFE